MAISAEERQALTDSLQRLLADRGAEADVRRAMETPAGYDAALWREMADMGIVGLVIEEAFGGSDAGPAALERVMEEVGAALLCSPLLASGVLAAELIRAAGDAAVKTRLLPGIAAGTTIATTALTGDAGTWTEAGVALDAAADDAGAWRLTGHASYVPHGQNADAVVALARTADGLALFEVGPRGPGVAVTTLATFDHTLRLARLEFDGAPAARLKTTVPAWETVRQALALTLVALAGEQAGGARRCLEFTVDYAKTRVQFGRAIGSFQAIKHMAADLLLETESAISAARNAAERLEAGAPDAAAAISLAAFACADAFTATAATSLQMHGGIAFTWAHPTHLYLRRARADAQLFGAPAQHRERYVQQLGG